MDTGIDTNRPVPAASPPSVHVEYAAITVGPNDSVLIAHDRRQLAEALVRGIPISRTLRIEGSPENVASVEAVEAGAMRQLRIAARTALTRRVSVYLASMGLPFLTAALLGLLGIWLQLIPSIGGPIGDFVGTAGAAGGGLPLAFVIAAMPSVWLIRRVHRAARKTPSLRLQQGPIAPSKLRVQGDLGAFAADARESMRGIAGILSGNPRLSGEQAHRLANRFNSLGRIAAQHGVPSVIAFAADAGEQFRQASQPPSQLIPGLRLRRRPASIAHILAPYSQQRSGRIGAAASLSLSTSLGLLIAALAFVLSGAFLITGDEALLLRSNESTAFPSSGTVLSLGRGFDGPSEADPATLTVVQGPGMFWAWPRPLSDRKLLRLSDQSLDVSVPFPGDQAGTTLQITFRYDISNLKSFVATIESVEEIDLALARVVAVDLAQDFAAVYEHGLATTEAPSSPASISSQLRKSVGDRLNRFVAFTETSAAFASFGVTLRANPAHSFTER